MCYLIAKKFDEVGSIALYAHNGQELAEFKRRLLNKVGFNYIQLVTISRPSAYGEYEPYSFVDNDNKEEFEKEVLIMKNREEK